MSGWTGVEVVKVELKVLVGERVAEGGRGNNASH